MITAESRKSEDYSEIIDAYNFILQHRIIPTSTKMS